MTHLHGFWPSNDSPLPLSDPFDRLDGADLFLGGKLRFGLNVEAGQETRLSMSSTPLRRARIVED